MSRKKESNFLSEGELRDRGFLEEQGFFDARPLDEDEVEDRWGWLFDQVAPGEVVLVEMRGDERIIHRDPAIRTPEDAMRVMALRQALDPRDAERWGWAHIPALGSSEVLGITSF